VGTALCGLGAVACVLWAEQGRLFGPHAAADTAIGAVAPERLD
jgi:hypothetical protein